MLRISVEVRKSNIHGQGIFALNDIQEDRVIWEFDPGLDRHISLFAVKHAEPRIASYIMERGYINPKHPNQVVLCLDEAQFWNFPKPGEKANCCLGGELDGEAMVLAARPISAGEELTVPPESDHDYARKMAAKS
jgi:SET domain-containing protein